MAEQKNKTGSGGVSLMALVSLACLLGVVCAKPARLPLNSNFVNGPWSRIGKRTNTEPLDATLGEDTRLCAATVAELEHFDVHILFAYYMRCLKGKSWFRMGVEDLLESSDGN
jgi:hypothetical protein